MMRKFIFTNVTSVTHHSQEILPKSGTIIDIGRNKLFKLSGSSVLPAYPGFIVMKTAHC